MNKPQKREIGRNDPCPCGSGNKYKKCCSPMFDYQAAPANGSIQTPNPAVSKKRLSDLSNLAIAHLKSGNEQQALLFAKQALEENPLNADAMHVLANILLSSNQIDMALDYITKAVAINDKDPSYYLTLGSLYSIKNNTAAALDAYNRSLAIDPNGSAELFNNLGVAMRQLGKYEYALTAFNRAVELKPDYALAYHNAGDLLIDMGDAKGAVREYERATEIRGGNPSTYANMARAQSICHNFDKAIECAQKSLEMDSKNILAYLTLSDSYYRTADYDSAQQVLSEAMATAPCAKFRLEQALITPVIPMSNDEIDAIYQQFIGRMEGLTREGFVLRYPEKEITNFPFYMGYYGRNNRPLMEAMADMFEKACPSLLYVAEHCKKPVAKKPKPKVGFISEYFHQHVISKCFNPILAQLVEHDLMDVHIFATSLKHEMKSANFIGNLDNFHTVPTDLYRARQIIAEHKLDMVMYADIGMSQFTYFLAFARLAPIQCVMSGHPITSGLKTMDYFLSSVDVESPNGKDHYTEKVVLLDGIALHCLEKPITPSHTKTRAELGLPDNGEKLYCCPVYMHRVHVDMDAAFKRILENDANARIVFFEHYYKTEWKKMLLKRFSLTMPQSLLERFVFVPYAQGENFIQTLRNVDAILDAFHFSMATTLPQIFADGLPVVHLPADFMRGRVAYKCYKDMNVPDLIARDANDYADIAMRVANDKDFRAMVSQKISAGHPAMFGNNLYTESVEKFCLDAYFDRPIKVAE